MAQKHLLLWQWTACQMRNETDARPTGRATDTRRLQGSPARCKGSDGCEVGRYIRQCPGGRRKVVAPCSQQTAKEGCGWRVAGRCCCELAQSHRREGVLLGLAMLLTGHLRCQRLRLCLREVAMRLATLASPLHLQNPYVKASRLTV